MFLSLVTVFPVHSGGWWRVQDTTASITQDMPQAKKTNVKTVFLVYFDKKRKCRPEIGFVVMEGTDFGNPEWRLKNEGKMKIIVDGLRFTGDATLSKYDNAMEQSMFLHKDALNKIKNSNEIIVEYSGINPIAFYSNGGFSKIEEAEKNCERN